MKDFICDLWNHFQKKLFLLTGLMVIISATEGFGLILFLPFISLLSSNDLYQNGTSSHISHLLTMIGIKESLVILAILIMTIFVFQGFISIIHGKIIANLESTYVDLWRRKLLNVMLKAKWSYFVEHKTGQLLFLFGTETERLGRALLLVGQIASCIILLIIYFVIATYLSWQFSLGLIFIGLMGFFFITHEFAQKAYETGKSYAENNSRLLHHVNEFLRTAKMIKATNSEERILEVCSKLFFTLKKDYFGAVFYPYVLRSILEFFIIMGICLSLLLLHHMGIPFTSIIILMAVCLRMLPKLHTLQSSYQMLTGYLPSFENLKIQLNVANLAADDDIFEPNNLMPFKAPISIRFSDVSIYYENIRALNNLNFEIKEGTICAIVGASGAGKSTLIDLIVKIVQPASGNIQINNKPLKEIPTNFLRRSIGYVTQESLLLHDTIWNNIVWGISDYSEENVLWASKLANAHEFIQALPHKYNTIVGEQGNKLSGGQRQRIVLARALVSKPKLLILDEATSGLDIECEHTIIKTLRQLRGELTLVVVTHRLAPVRIADHIIVLDSGSIIQSGTWDELTNQKGHFANLLTS